MAGSIIIVGLGPGKADLLTEAARQALATAREIWARTQKHPTIADLPDLNWRSFDFLYEETEAFADVYKRIVDRVIQLSTRDEGVVYAVPGSPWVGEATVTKLRQEAGEKGIDVRVIHGISFLEPVLDILELDALSGVIIVDAIELATRHHPQFPPSAHVLAAQLYSRRLAGDVKLTLMNQYPEDHPVQLIHAAGTGHPQRETVLLHEIDRSEKIEHLTTLYIPPMEGTAFEDLQETIAHLRAPEGCPWDREQTHQTIRGNLLEETYEVLDALDKDDPAKMQEELGDLLLQILLHTQMATEAGNFRMADVVEGIDGKLKRRHPHVFGQVEVNGVGDVLKNWEQIKAAERGKAAHGEEGLLDGVPSALPALEQAISYQKRAARVGFDWPEIAGVYAKVQEELLEVQEAADEAERAAEIGDLFFALANYARWLKVDAESALREANRRFRGRFRKMEAAIKPTEKKMKDLSLEEWDALWEQAKRE